MILVDSCVWIDYLRGRKTPEVHFLEQFESNFEREICISGIIYSEVLRGISRVQQRTQAAKALTKLERKDFHSTSYEKMLQHDLTCRKHGITLSKLGDWLILQTALDHNLELLTSDDDFKKIFPYVPLKLVNL